MSCGMTHQSLAEAWLLLRLAVVRGGERGGALGSGGGGGGVALGRGEHVDAGRGLVQAAAEVTAAVEPEVVTAGKGREGRHGGGVEGGVHQHLYGRGGGRSQVGCGRRGRKGKGG